MNMQNSEMTTTGSFLEKVINTMPGGVFVYRANEKQEILYMNREILHLWDCQDKDQFMEFCGGSFRGMIHPDDRDLVEQEIISQLRLGNRDFDHVRYRMIDREGNVKTKTREKVFNMHRILQVQGTERKVYLYLIYGVNLSSVKEGAILIENSDATDVREEQTNAHEQGCTQQIRD